MDENDLDPDDSGNEMHLDEPPVKRQAVSRMTTRGRARRGRADRNFPLQTYSIRIRDASPQKKTLPSTNPAQSFTAESKPTEPKPTQSKPLKDKNAAGDKEEEQESNTISLEQNLLEVLADFGFNRHKKFFGRGEMSLEIRCLEMAEEAGTTGHRREALYQDPEETEANICKGSWTLIVSAWTSRTTHQMPLPQWACSRNSYDL